MISLRLHVTWIDVIQINKTNYFNLLWTCDQTQHQASQARPPQYLIFYDLNTAQVAQIYKEHSLEHNWNLELIESYIKDSKPSLNIRKKSAKNHTSVLKSYEEILFICQFKFNSSATNKNKLQQSVIDYMDID